MKKYFLHLYGQSNGPYSFEELRAMNINPTTPVWFEGMGDWKKANEIGELKMLFYNNAQTTYQQPTSFSQPVAHSTYSFPQNNFGQPVKKKSPAVLIGVLAGVFLVVIIGGIFLVSGYQEKKRRMMSEMEDSFRRIDEDRMRADSIQMADSMAAVDAMDSYISSSSSAAAVGDYTGSFTNYAGGTVYVSGYDNQHLRITVSFTSISGPTCTGEVKGTGAETENNKVEMTTSSGCTIKLIYTSSDLVTVEESYDCKSEHGSNCSFDGLYIRE